MGKLARAYEQTRFRIFILLKLRLVSFNLAQAARAAQADR